MRRFLVPVLEDALERSLALAAGMDTRGYGRSGGATRRERWLTGSLLLLALTGICVGTYAWLDPTAPRVLALPMLAAGAAVAVLGWYVGHTQVVVAYPGVDAMPYLSPLALAVGVLGTVPAVTTPIPTTALGRREVAA